MIENIKNEIYVRLEILFAEAATHELTNDMECYHQSLEKIALVAKPLGINTTITKINIHMNKVNDSK